jgi:hypothetical protein
MEQYKPKLNVYRILLTSIILICGCTIYGQVLNDNCSFATAIPSTDNYCSGDGQFSNTGAKADPVFPNTCVQLLWQNGVWFSFVPKKPAALIRVFGSGQGGTIRNPKIVVFQRCGVYLQCSPGKTIGNDELLIDNLNIGQTYYFMIESPVGGEGTFKLCVNDFTPVPSPEADCSQAVVLCDKSSFSVQSLTGIGNDRNEIEAGNCMEAEFQSAWYKWTCDVAGPLTFTLTPNNHRDRNTISDDLDFALYELPNGINDCRTKRLIRCMASGANGTAGATDPLSTWINCNGPTGLMVGDNDISEAPGCQSGNNNFVSALNMEVGKSYVLVINNYSRSGLGFGIQFGGTGTFLGPKPDFDINANLAFECDKSIVFTDKSTSSTDPIITYTWNMGDRAVPDRQTGKGPHNTTYQSFGDKIAALTVETSRGCVVTKIKEFFVQPCCKDTSTLRLNAAKVDLRCYDIPEGSILAQPTGGAPDYRFMLNNGAFTVNPMFSRLDTGIYSLIVQDSKGCADTLIRSITEPPEIFIDAGDDQTIEFGDSTRLNGSYVSFNGKDTLIWTPAADFRINGITDPEVFPKDNTTYFFTLTDKKGCKKQDTVLIRVNKNYMIHAPNIFSPNRSGTNEFFNIWTTRGVKYVELLEVYDRWGNLVYQGKDVKAPISGTLITNDINSGWDGKVKRKDSNETDTGPDAVTGVYAWRARVRFIDDEVKNFAGDLTLVR